MFLYQANGNLIAKNNYVDNIIEHVTPVPQEETTSAKPPLRFGQIVEMNLNIGGQDTADQFSQVKIFKVIYDANGAQKIDDTYTGEIKSDDPVVIKNAANTDFKLVKTSSNVLEMLYDPDNSIISVQKSKFNLSKVTNATSYAVVQLETDSIRAGEKIFLSYNGNDQLNSPVKNNCGLFGCRVYHTLDGKFGHGKEDLKAPRTISINTYYNQVGSDSKKIEDPIKYGDIVNISNLLDYDKDNFLGNYVKILNANNTSSTDNIKVNDQVIIVDANDPLRRILYDTTKKNGFSEHYISYHTTAAVTPNHKFYLRPDINRFNYGNFEIYSGENIVLDYDGNTGYTGCGWYGCRVYNPDSARFGHGKAASDIKYIQINRIKEPIKYGYRVNIFNFNHITQLDDHKEFIILKAGDETSTDEIKVNDEVMIVDADDTNQVLTRDVNDLKFDSYSLVNNNTFFLRPHHKRINQGNYTIRVGDKIAISDTSSTGFTDNCGWYGCGLYNPNEGLFRHGQQHNGSLDAPPNYVQISYSIPQPIVTMTITSSTISSGDITNNPTINLTFTSSEVPDDFDASYIKVNNGTLKSFSGGTFTFSNTADSKKYIAVLTMKTDGFYTVEVEAGKFTDTVGNPNSASNKFTFTYDSSRPEMTITSETVNSEDTTNVRDIELKFESSEATTDFDQNKIKVTNGSLSDFSGSSKVYSAKLTPDGDGKCTVQVQENEFTDAANNSNKSSNKFTFTYDGSGPQMTITSDTVTSGETTNDSSINLTFTSSEATNNFGPDDITVSNNGTLSNFNNKFQSSTEYTATLTPDGDGEYTVQVDAGKFTDDLGNLNENSNIFTWTCDRKSPEITITSNTVSNGDTTNNSSIILQFVTSKATTDFFVGDITVTNGSLSNFSGVRDIVYSATLTPLADGKCTVDVFADVFTDAVGNSNIAATQFTWTYNSTSSTTPATTPATTALSSIVATTPATTATIPATTATIPATTTTIPTTTTTIPTTTTTIPTTTTTTTNNSGGGISISLIIIIILTIIIYMLLKKRI